MRRSGFEPRSSFLNSVPGPYLTGPWICSYFFPNGGFKDFENDTRNCLLKKKNWSGQSSRIFNFSRLNLILKYGFRPVKLPGLKKRAPGDFSKNAKGPPREPVTFRRPGKSSKYFEGVAWWGEMEGDQSSRTEYKGWGGGGESGKLNANERGGFA